MKKISILLIFIILLLSSCKQMKTYDSPTPFLESCYETINDDKVKYVCFDLRTKDLYEAGHIRQFQNYDLDSGNIDELISHLTTNYNKKTICYIYDNNTIDEELVKALKNHFDKLYILSFNDNKLLEEAKELFTIDKGPYNCGC